MLKALFCLLLMAPSLVLAQYTPLGLYEGSMANSGVAISDSKAPSYYNPSLLRQRTDHAFNVNGTSVSTFRSKDSSGTFSSSLGLSPGYLSTILVGTHLVHELFMANTLQGQFSWSSQPSPTSKMDLELNINRLVSGYSMAFKNIPLALQVLARYSESRSNGFSENDSGGGVYSFGTIKNEFKNLNLALGVSTHLRFGSYTFGANFNTRGAALYKKNEGRARVFTHGSPTPNDLTINEFPSYTSIDNEEGKLIIGHGFKVGNHEFLTDSTFVEYSAKLNRYQFRQNFGYRYGQANGHQLLCGVGHAFGSDVESLGQSFNASVGYSWMTRKQRSSIGLFYLKDETRAQSSALGLLFGSEFEY